MAEPQAPGTGGPRSWRPVAVVAAALGAIVLLAALADGRLLVADPDASAVTPADVRLARSLFGGVTPPENLAEACIDEEGTIDPACLDDGQPGELDADLAADVVPRECREQASISASCLERELGIDVPAECADEHDRLDVGCLAGRGALVVLTERCLDDGRVRQECLEGRVFGVPDPGPADGVEDVYVPDRVDTGDPQAAPSDAPLGRPDPSDRDEDDDRDEEDERSGLEKALDGVLDGVGLLLAVALLVGLVALVVVLVLRRRPRPGAPVEPDADEEAHDRAVMAASLDAGARRLDLDGDPRQAIIAAYALLLEGLTACAQGRHPAETPLEHLERVLAALDVRPEPLRELTALFGEARFSDHAMTDAQRDRARAALQAAAADLDRVRETVG
jgi:hypothetical protein